MSILSCMLDLLGCRRLSFHEVVVAGDLTATGRLIGANPDVVNSVNDKGETALHYAPNHSMAKLLLDAGADVNKRVSLGGGSGYSPIHSASSRGCTATVWLLIERETDVDQVGWHSQATPLMAAATNGHLETVNLLLEQGADPSIRNAEGKTAIECAVGNLDVNDTTYTDGDFGIFRERRRIIIKLIQAKLDETSSTVA